MPRLHLALSLAFWVATACAPVGMATSPTTDPPLAPDPESAAPEPTMTTPTPAPIFDFGDRAAAFRAVDDRVMGGVSQSRFERADAGHGVFAGHLSLDNNGGFASVRADGVDLDLSDVTTLVLRARGDGRRDLHGAATDRERQAAEGDGSDEGARDAQVLLKWVARGAEPFVQSVAGTGYALLHRTECGCFERVSAGIRLDGRARRGEGPLPVL